MADLPSIPDSIRTDLVDIAIDFLKNPTIIDEPIDRKRQFLQKKGLTDTEINEAFQFLPVGDISSTQIQTPSTTRKILSDLTFAGILVFAIHLIKEKFLSPKPTHEQSTENDSFNQLIANLQKSIQSLQSTINKLEQTASSLAQIDPQQTSTSINELKLEIESLKRSFQPLPSKTSTSDNDSDGIVIISE